MTSFTRPPMPPVLDAADLPEGAKDALLDLDAALFQWHRMLMKGELTGRLLEQAGVDLEISLFQGLMAVVRITHGVARPAPMEPTVGLVAEEMSIDPSRASRICSALIAKGYIERAAAQDDGRKSVLLLTEQGDETFRALWEVRWTNLLRVFDDWSEDDIATFSRLFGRYAEAVLAT